MKSLEEITNIICNLDDKLFDKLLKAEDQRWNLDSKSARNGKKRLLYNLKKINLTEDEWYEWVAN